MVFSILFKYLNSRTLPGEDASLNDVEPETIRQESLVSNRKLNQTGRDAVILTKFIFFFKLSVP